MTEMPTTYTTADQITDETLALITDAADAIYRQALNEVASFAANREDLTPVDHAIAAVYAMLLAVTKLGNGNGAGRYEIHTFSPDADPAFRNGATHYIGGTSVQVFDDDGAGIEIRFRGMRGAEAVVPFHRGGPVIHWTVPATTITVERFEPGYL